MAMATSPQRSFPDATAGQSGAPYKRVPADWQVIYAGAAAAPILKFRK